MFFALTVSALCNSYDVTTTETSLMTCCLLCLFAGFRSLKAQSLSVEKMGTVTVLYIFSGIFRVLYVTVRFFVWQCHAAFFPRNYLRHKEKQAKLSERMKIFLIACVFATQTFPCIFAQDDPFVIHKGGYLYAAGTLSGMEAYNKEGKIPGNPDLVYLVTG